MSVIKLDEGNFDQIVTDSEKPVLIDFWAEWCRLQSTVIEKLANELEGSATIAKLNIDESPKLAARFSVMSIPTLVAMKAGKIVGRRSGVTSKETLLDMITSARE